ncbi:MAG TPA: inositol monophosphatase family protein [Gemmatimonadaceae bacterium]|nr:inositol monophosphatase family protein [Gemmatimonadaceae bacterium]
MQAKRKIEAGDAQLIDEALEVSIEAARDAAHVIRESSGALDDLEWVEKASADFVTEVDRGAESAITATIQSAFAKAVILGEELTPETVLESSALTFIVDPLDGTTNFLHGFPHFSVSIAVMYLGELQAAVVLNVPRGDLFTAKTGSGTQLNGAPVTVSSIDSTSRALIGTGFPFKNHELLDEYAKQFVEICRHTAGIRRAGSAALDLADVACGRFDGFWELVLAPWDVAAGILLVREAGGIVTDLSGKNAKVAHGAYVAGNPFIHRWLIEAIRNA